MAFMGMGNKKEEDKNNQSASEQAPQPPSSPPVEKVVAMKQQGFSNNQITTYLQREGYSPDLIFDAMNQANIKQGVENPAGGAGYSQPAQPSQPQYQQQPPQPPSGAGNVDNSQIEEVAEAIIDEKWNELVKSINKIIDWKDKMESRINSMEQELKDLKSNFNSLHDSILGKVGEYDQNITKLGSDIKAMEKVFQKILPTLTDSINQLSRISKGMKKSSK